MIMKRISFALCSFLLTMSLFAQNNRNNEGLGMDFYAGIWVYQSNDTIFRISLQVCKYIFDSGYKSNVLCGSYYLSVGGNVIDDYLAEFPKVNIIIEGNRPPKLCIEAVTAHNDSLTPSPRVAVRFYDKRKRHFNGEGLRGGYMKLLSPDKLLWQMDEKEGIDIKTHGWDEEIQGPKPSTVPIGFSVPEHAVLTREKK